MDYGAIPLTNSVKQLNALTNPSISFSHDARLVGKIEHSVDRTNER